jgi:hypothetical protein
VGPSFVAREAARLRRVLADPEPPRTALDFLADTWCSRPLRRGAASSVKEELDRALVPAEIVTMRVRCVKNRIADVADQPELHRYLLRSVHLDGVLPVPIGGRFVVYAVEPRAGVDGYYIVTDEGDDYPKAYPAPFFEVEDPRRSIHFVTAGALTTFPEWAEDPMFYERLVDGAPREVAIFRRMRDVLDLEHADPAITETASVIDAAWVQCPACEHVWEAPASGEMLRCPGCGRVLRRPFC